MTCGIQSVTMVPKFYAVVLLALFALANQATAQECVAQSVVDLKLTANHILSWEVREDETCLITQFLVYIFHRDRPIEYSFEVEETEVDVSFLQVCTEWTFLVIPVSNHTRGREHHLFDSMPLPTHADLSIAYINVTRSGVTGDLHLTWDLTDPRYGSCSLRYRVTVEEDESPDIQDLYLSERSVNLHFLSPCTKYQFGVRAINIAHPTIEGPLRSSFYDIPPSKQDAPKLAEVILAPNDFNMTWALEGVRRNRCEVTEFYVYGGIFFNMSVLYDDTPERDHIQLAVHSLRPNSMYYMRASVQNSAGWSDPTVVAVQTLDASPDDEVVKVLHQNL